MVCSVPANVLGMYRSFAKVNQETVALVTPLMERLTAVWLVWKVSEEWLEMEMDACVACFLSGGAARQPGWRAPWAGTWLGAKTRG